MKRFKKRPFTLLEIMIVIFLIGLIGSVVSYNMKGSMDKGRAFKTEQAMIQIEDILTLEMAKGNLDAKTVAERAEEYLKLSGLVKDSKTFIQDGWGEKFEITGTDKGVIKVTSKAYRRYKDRQNSIVKDKSIIANEEQKASDG